jgi:hypothetical protein
MTIYEIIVLAGPNRMYYTRKFSIPGFYALMIRSCRMVYRYEGRPKP